MLNRLYYANQHDHVNERMVVHFLVIGSLLTLVKLYLMIQVVFNTMCKVFHSQQANEPGLAVKIKLNI